MMEHKTLSLAEQVFERLETDILCGTYQIGEVLTELKLVNDLGVSRTPIREALRRLEQEHLVEISSKGILVVGVTDKDLEDIYAIRVRIEGMASYEATVHMSEEQLNELRETVELQEFYVSKKNAESIRVMDSRFHQLIYRFSKSSVLFDTLMPLHKKTQKFRKKSVENESRAALSASEHRAIYEAMAARDAVLAEKLTIKHIENARNHMKKRSK
jgi:DNA-binding GntR family transcriptional regulator